MSDDKKKEDPERVSVNVRIPETIRMENLSSEEKSKIVDAMAKFVQSFGDQVVNLLIRSKAEAPKELEVPEVLIAQALMLGAYFRYALAHVGENDAIHITAHACELGRDLVRAGLGERAAKGEAIEALFGGAQPAKC